MITQAEIDSLNWYHDFDFPTGLKARAADRLHPILWSFIKDKLATVSFTDKSVIDIGCWDGYFSFLAEELGAKSVLAIDDYSQNWGAQECFLLAKELNSSKITMLPDVSVYDLSNKIQEKFDIILFLGVHYHLHSPYTAFAQIRALCHEESVVIIEGDCIRNDEEAYAKITLDAPSVSKFFPTTKLLRDMLQSCYLKVERMEFLGEQNTAPREHAVESIELKQRLVILAKPFRSVNTCHMYKPPFGLDQFDPRYSREFRFTQDIQLLKSVEPTKINAGKIVEIPVNVKNTSDFVWDNKGSNPVTFSYHWLNSDEKVIVFDGERTVLPRSLAPQDSEKLNAVIKAPDRPGNYSLTLTMVMEGVTWFETKGAKYLKIPVTVISQ